MSLNQTIHKNLLIRVLKEIFSHPKVGPLLGFKGGTAAYLFFQLDRFSVDLDFDLLDTSKVDLVFTEIQAILGNFGVLRIADKKRYSLIFILSYEDKVPDAQNVKVEVNLRNFGSRYMIKPYLGIPMKVMIPEDMAANKIVAFYERMGKANRDIYDIYFMLSHNWRINHEIVELRTGLAIGEFLDQCCIMLENANSRGIMNGLGEVLSLEQKTWVRNHLVKELIFQLRLYKETYT